MMKKETICEKKNFISVKEMYKKGKRE